NHSGYNTSSWNFFDRERFKISPAGGEFSYYTNYDQRNVLNPDEGAYGVPYEIFAQNFHITYINGNDQNRYQTLARIKEASMNSGYKFKLTSFKTKSDSSIVEVINLGVAPIYIDAFVTVNGVRSTESLKLLSPDETRLFHVSAGGDNATITIESDDILDTETIQYFGTVNEYVRYTMPDIVLGSDSNESLSPFNVYPTITDRGRVNISHQGNQPFNFELYNMQGKLLTTKKNSFATYINVSSYPKGLYLLVLKSVDNYFLKQKLVFR
ncbi:hypothetical protein MNBD_BACTEROID06-1257, partial [hydrothermal vent metagenome]